MFHNICDFIKEEMKEIDHKIGGGARPSNQELEYADLLAHMKKSLLTVDAMEHPEEYGWNDDGMSNTYARSYRTGRYNSRGRYNRSYRDNDSMMEDLRDLIDKAPDEKTRRKLEHIMSDMSEM